MSPKPAEQNDRGRSRHPIIVSIVSLVIGGLIAALSSYWLNPHQRTPLPVAAFVCDQTTLEEQAVLRCEDRSEFADSLTWSLGDEAVETNADTVAHTFNTAGRKEISLIASNARGKDEKTLTINVLERKALDSPITLNVYGQLPPGLSVEKRTLSLADLLHRTPIQDDGSWIVPPSQGFKIELAKLRIDAPRGEVRGQVLVLDDGKAKVTLESPGSGQPFVASRQVEGLITLRERQVVEGAELVLATNMVVDHEGSYAFSTELPQSLQSFRFENESGENLGTAELNEDLLLEDPGLLLRVVSEGARPTIEVRRPITLRGGDNASIP